MSLTNPPAQLDDCQDRSNNWFKDGYWLVSFNRSQHGRFAQSGGWVRDLPWLEDRHFCSQEVEWPPSQGTELHPLHREPHWSSQYVWHKITNLHVLIFTLQITQINKISRKHKNCFVLNRFTLNDHIISNHDFLFLSHVFSQVGRSWEVQRVYDPDVLNLYWWKHSRRGKKGHIFCTIFNLLIIKILEQCWLCFFCCFRLFNILLLSQLRSLDSST